MKLDLDEALQAFIVESRELLDQMEAALLSIEQNPDDVEIINAIFRAMHTIKGSSGIFGLDGIVAFTHTAESVLDEVRAGGVRIDGALATTLLASGDHVRQLVQAVSDGRSVTADTLAVGADLSRQLQAVLDGLHGAADAQPAAAPSDTPAAASHAADGLAAAAQPAHWHLSLRFGADTIREGFDPLSFVRYLNGLGELRHVELLTHRIPALGALGEPDDCHLGFEIALRSQADEQTLHQAFEFVRSGSRIVIVPPGSPAPAYEALLDDGEDQADAVREALQRCGSWPEAIAPDRPATDDAPPRDTPEAEAARDAGPTDEVGRTTAGAAGSGPRQPAAEVQMLRVDAAKLDHLINLVGELLIAGAGTSLIARQRKDKALIQATSTVARLMEEVRDSALSLRMVQIGGTFNRFQRVVRDVSKELGKDIVLSISGAETELDKTVVERLADPLTHLVRNAMDHGIEPAELRAAAGKPLQGQVHLHAFHEAGHVVVEVHDDGRGLSRERIFQVAVQRGLISADAVLSDHDVYQLIFQPGFSTAEQVSKISGRGVGMDVVARSIADLRGTIDIDTEPGEGTVVRLRLPLTLAIIDGFLLGVGTASYVVPLTAVVECIELTGDIGLDRDWMDLRGEVLPIIRLRELFSVEGAPGRRQNVVVLRHGDLRFGLVVDQLMGELQTVIRPLGRVFQGLPGIGGFTILGTGSVALLLDVPSLLRQVGAVGDAVTGSAVSRHESACATVSL